jgi:hypothetical protein
MALTVRRARIEECRSAVLLLAEMPAVVVNDDAGQSRSACRE